MASLPRRPRLTLSLPVTLAACIGAGVALLFALVPQPALETLVNATGLPRLVAAAEPPLGLTARAVLVLLGGGLVGMLFWGALALAFPGSQLPLGGRRAKEKGVPVLRRADAHPDAPARAPLSAARDLGTPFLEIHAADPIVDEEMDAGFAEAEAAVFDAPEQVERTIPADLDTPLSVFDPAAFSATTPALAPGERIETFDLHPPAPAQQPVMHRPREPRDTEATITALLERLERGVTQRAARASPVARRMVG